MTYDESVQYLFSLGRELASPRQPSATKFDLKNITILCEHLGQPQREFQSVHVAGTNGKGSTSAMLDSILRAAGLRTGLYTSPHLERINERIRLDGKEISDDEFAAAFTRVRRQVHQPARRDGSGAEQHIGPPRRRRVPRAPAHHLGVEGDRRLPVGRRQLVPDEAAVQIRHR